MKLKYKYKTTGTKLVIYAMQDDKQTIADENDVDFLPRVGKVIAIGVDVKQVGVGDIVTFKNYAVWRILQSNRWVLEEDDVIEF